MFICTKLRDLGIGGLKDKINNLKEIEFLNPQIPVIMAFSVTIYFSVQTGFRFSLKAVIPSIASGHVACEAIISLARW